MAAGKGHKGGKENKPGLPNIQNRQARHEYHILESFEAGIVLLGSEIKSIREGKVNIGDAYARIMNGEAWIIGMNIQPYRNINTFDPYDPTRTRKLLLRRKQIEKLHADTREKGLTLIPLKIYFKNGMAKMELGLGKGKKLHDRREDIKERDAKREIQRAMKR
ncbi:MAG: SsrA-binding protein SmpB [Nitrospinae bacterium]|nr:SsrA-binding protein SmpB [Nitrospinota bacterium]